MIEVPRWRLTGGCDIPYKEYHIRQPILRELFDQDYKDFIGFDGYRMYLSFVLIDAKSLHSMLPGLFGDVPESILENMQTYPMLQQFGLLPMIVPALGFFIREPVRYNEKAELIEVCNSQGEPISSIGADELLDIRSIILKCSYMGTEESVEKPKFANKAAYEIWLKIQKGRQATKKKKADENINIPNLMESLAANHGGYNMFNIKDLTIYQLYDQFYRVNNRIQLDVYGTRWAAYGEDAFDFTMWYKDAQSNSEQ